MNEVNKELGALVRSYREKLGMTQFVLANLLGYDSTQFISLFERGLARVPFTVIGKLVIILGIPEKKVMDILTTAFEADLRESIEEGKKSLVS